MVLRDIMNLFPAEEATNLLLLYFDKETETQRGEDLYIRFNDPENAFDLMIAEHFADDEILDITNHFNEIKITVDRIVSKETVIRWKTQAAEAVKLNPILRDWEE